MESAESTRPVKHLLVICRKRQLEAIMNEFEDWNQKEGLDIKVALYGTTHKSKDGFVLFALTKPLPEGVYMNLDHDDDIVDYIQFYAPPLQVPPA
jgi:hypothetical protein